MIKKIFLLFIICVTLTVNSFAVDVSSCPSGALTNNTEYVIQSNFIVDATPCFNLNGFSDITITAVDEYIPISLNVNFANGERNTIEFLDINSLYATLGNSNHTDILSSRFRKQGNLYSFQGTTNMYDVEIRGNLFQASSPNINFMSTTDNNIPFSYGGSSFIYDLELINNDFEGFNTIFSGLQWQRPTGAQAGQNLYLNGIVDISGNNFGTTGDFSGTRVFTQISDCVNDWTSQNNYFGYLGATHEDLNSDKTTDTTYVKQISSCYISQDFVPTHSTMNNDNLLDNDEQIRVYAFASFYSSSFFSNMRDYIITSTMNLDAQNYFNLAGRQNVNIDFTYAWNNEIIYLEQPRVFRMGNNNGIIGNENYKTDFRTLGTINVGDSGFFGNNWHLIEYDNALTIKNIDFNMNAVSDYGLVRKRDTNIDGINFVFENNIFDLNYVPVTLNRPQFVIGAFSTFRNNEFDLLSTDTISVIGWGISDSISGGHIITDNSFDGGGFIFNNLQSVFGGTNYESKFIHNEFNKIGSLYAYPFNPVNNTANLLENPQLNGSYYYTTPCTNYEFNVGNWYEFWEDASAYNDSNGDGIHDSFGGLDYIELAFDFNLNPIRDYRSVTPYPFNFATQTGNAISTTDTCITYTYNIVSPIAQNYSSGTELTSNWEFISLGLNDLYCFETLNGFTTLYEGVSSGDNKGVTYDTTDGQGFFNIKCCDTPACDNFVEESETVEFCIGDCNLGNLIVNDADEPDPPVLGCTDPQANNYNPLATQDDGSCTYNGSGSSSSGGGGDLYNGSGINIGSDIGIDNLFSGDVDDIGENVNGLFGLLSIPSGYLIVLGLVFLGICCIVLVFSIPFMLIGGRK